LYLCPTGPLLEQIETFYEESLKLGFNAAHNYLPHITLCSFFQAPDEAVQLLVSGLEHSVEKMRTDLPVEMNLNFYKTDQFIGLFLSEEHNDMFKRLANVFMRECSEFISGGELGPMHVISTCFPWCSSYPLLHPKRIEVEPYLKSLHLTLAYQFDKSVRDTLNQMVDSIVKTNTPCVWELKLLSRETRVKGHYVYRVIQSNAPAEGDELELVIGDLLYVHPDAVSNAADEWVPATSWLTGISGMIPLTLCERTTESAAWTLHKSITLSSHSNGCSGLTTPAAGASSVPLPPPTGTGDSDSSPLRSSIDSGSSCRSNCAASAALTNDSQSTGERHVVVMRHAERVDFTFGSGWISVCFDQDGKYQRRDLNQPEFLPKRTNPFDYSLDTPLTVLGCIQASITGKALRNSPVRIDNVFCSPSLRCIETAACVIKEINPSITIKIEPGLFEWLSWYPLTKRPVFMEPADLVKFGYPVDVFHTPFMTTEDLFSKDNESVTEYYERSFALVSHLMSETTGNVLLVAHASSLEVCTRQLVGEPVRSPGDMLSIVKGIPYAAVSMAKEEKSEESVSQPADGDVKPELKFKLVKPPILTLQHSMNQKYNWKSLRM
jgi:ubiquitin-associated SH3 domain-containing protein